MSNVATPYTPEAIAARRAEYRRQEREPSKMVDDLLKVADQIKGIDFELNRLCGHDLMPADKAKAFAEIVDGRPQTFDTYSTYRAIKDMADAWMAEIEAEPESAA